MPRFKKKPQFENPDAPLLHEDHPRPRTRREFIQQGFLTGGAMAATGSWLSLFANPNEALAAVSPDLDALAGSLAAAQRAVGQRTGQRVEVGCHRRVGFVRVAEQAQPAAGCRHRATGEKALLDELAPRPGTRVILVQQRSVGIVELGLLLESGHESVLIVRS